MRQAREKSFSVASQLQPELFNDEERNLYQAMQPIGTAFLRSRDERRYPEALKSLVMLAPWIDAFFDKVMVMVENPAVRSNRLKLLNQIGRSFSGIAQFSEIVTEGKESKNP